MTLRVNHSVMNVHSFKETHFRTALEQLPMNWRPEVLKYVHLSDKMRSLEPRLLLMDQLKAMGISQINYAEMGLTDYKKPYFPKLPNIHFSFSHSYEMAICAVCDSGRVGVDIEFVKPVNFDHVLASLSDLEWKDVKSARNPLKRFYEIWTAKEAIIKADGRGMYAPLKSIELTHNFAKLGESHWNLTRIELGDDYCGFVAHEDHCDKQFDTA